MDDAKRMGRVPNGSRHYKSKLTEQQARAALREVNAGRATQAEMGRRYGVHKNTIHSLVSGASWKHLHT